MFVQQWIVDLLYSFVSLSVSCFVLPRFLVSTHIVHTERKTWNNMDSSQKIWLRWQSSTDKWIHCSQVNQNLIHNWDGWDMWAKRWPNQPCKLCLCYPAGIPPWSAHLWVLNKALIDSFMSSVLSSAFSVHWMERIFVRFFPNYYHDQIDHW